MHADTPNQKLPNEVQKQSLKDLENVKYIHLLWVTHGALILLIHK